MSRLHQILSRDDPEAVWSELSELICTHRPDSTTWSEIELWIVVLGGLDRWVTNGGLEGYLRMPASVSTPECLAALRALALHRFADALEHALSIFPVEVPGGDDGPARAMNQWARSGYEPTPNEKAGLLELSRVFFEKGEAIGERLVARVRSDPSPLRWIDGLT